MGFWNSLNTAFNSVANVGTNLLGTVLNSGAAQTAVGSLLGGAGGGQGTAGGNSAIANGGSSSIGSILSGLFGGNTSNMHPTPPTSSNTASGVEPPSFLRNLNPIWLLLPFGAIIGLIIWATKRR